MNDICSVWSGNLCDSGIDLLKWEFDPLFGFKLLHFLPNSGMRLLNSGIGAQFRNSHFEFEQANAGIEQISTSRGTYK